MSNFGSMLWGDAAPTIKTVLFCAIGAFLATRKKPILSPTMLKDFNRLIINVFVPALIFTKLVDATSLKALTQWWSLPMNVLAQVLPFVPITVAFYLS